MHHFLFLRLEGFYARSLLRKDQRPLVIHRNKRVLDVDAVAEARQIYRGMSLAEAKAILHEGAFVPWEEESYRVAQTAWLDLCTEVSDVIEPAEQHSAWIDLSLQPDAESLAFKLVRSVNERFGLHSIPGLGSTKWIARLASELRFIAGDGDPLSQCIRLREPVSNPAAFLAPLKTRYLRPVDRQHISRLEFLGYSTIGEVAKVPLNVLRSQFGEAATHIRMCARGGYFETVEAQYPPDSIAEKVAFDGAVEDLQTLDLGLQQLALVLSGRLQKEDKQGKYLVVTLEHEEFKTTVLKRKFTKPIQNYASALASLRLVAGTPEEPIVAVRARLENVTVSKRIQQELTGRTTSDDRERGALAAFQHIRTVFGDTAIQTGSDLVEPRRKQVLRAWKEANGWT